MNDYEAKGFKLLMPSKSNSKEFSGSKREFTNGDLVCERKEDGHRCNMQIIDDGNGKHVVGMFGGGISKETGFLSDFTDNLPHLTDEKYLLGLDLAGTVIDGELRYFKGTSKDVQSVTGALPDKAIAFQEDNGYLPYVVFDIRYYKGVCVENLPYIERRALLHTVVTRLRNPHIKVNEVFVSEHVYDKIMRFSKTSHIMKRQGLKSLSYTLVDSYLDVYNNILKFGGEGVMLKDYVGRYIEGKSNSTYKIKKLLTYDVIVMGFSPPIREYTGKYLEKWTYWEDEEGNKFELNGIKEVEKHEKKTGSALVPITKTHFNDWIGAIQYGTLVKDLKKDYNSVDINKSLMYNGECKGIDEQTLIDIKNNPDKYLHEVIEVKANSMLSTTKGTLQHPRFSRLRTGDKDISECTFKNHIKQT